MQINFFLFLRIQFMSDINDNKFFSVLDPHKKSLIKSYIKNVFYRAPEKSI